MSITGSSSIRRLSHVAFVVDLHEVSPVGRWATGGRDGRWFERFASPTRAMSLAHAIREVSWDLGLSHESQPWPVVSPPAACPPTACPPVAAARRLPTFPIASAVTADLSL